MDCTPMPATGSSAARTSTLAPVASALVSAILLANGGWIEGELVDVRVAAQEERTARRRPIQIALSEVRRILGATEDEEGITAATVEGVLTALGCGLAAAPAVGQTLGQDSWRVTLPSWRLDLEREIDLIEEVARVYGYNRFANTLPAFGEGVRALPWAEKEATVRGTLLAAGFHEAIGSSFCSAAEGALTAQQPGQVVPLGNPLSEEAGVLRPSLVPGMLAMIAGNLNRDVSDVRLFELGTVFSGTTDKVEERPALAFGAVGSLPEESALHATRAFEFHDVKGVVEQVLERFEMRAMYFDHFPAEAGITPEWLHPYRAARAVADGVTVGWFGQLHPREAAARKIKDAVLIGEIYLDRLYKLPLRRPVAREISRYQPVRRDFSLVLDESVAWETIDRAMAELKISGACGLAGARGLPRREAGQGRVCAAAGRDLPGAGPHAARGGAQGLSGARGGGRGQGWRAAEGLSARKRIRERDRRRIGAILERKRGPWGVGLISELEAAVETENEEQRQAGHEERSRAGGERGRFFRARRAGAARR